jgi:parvulin-like peptidyl-prolyl isomerase
MPDQSVSHSAPTASELGSWRLWRQLCRLRLAELSSRQVDFTDAELETAWQEFCRQNRLDPAAMAAVPRDFAPCSPEELRAAVARDLRIVKWKQQTFGPHSRGHFDQRKPALDRVVYFMIRVRDLGVARELWFRLKEKEATFAELAPRYTEGHELHTSGLLGPTAFGAMHPALASHLRAAEEGKLLKPLQVAEWFLVAQVEKFLPVEFDRQTQNAMVEELSQRWLDSKLDEPA